MNNDQLLDHEDAALDALLGMTARAETSEDAFVAEWERRAAAEDEACETFPTVSDDTDESTTSIPPPVAPPLFEPPLAPPVSPYVASPPTITESQEPWRISERGWQVFAVVAGCLA